MRLSAAPNIARDSTIVVASRIAGVAITLGTAMMLSRFRTLAEYGTYSQILIVISLLSTVILMGLPSSINYFVPRTEGAEQTDFLTHYFRTVTLLAAVIGLLAFAATPLFVWYYRNEMIRTYSFAFLILPWTTIIIGSAGNLFISTRKIRKLIIYNLAYGFCNMTAVLAVKLFKGTFFHYMIAYLLVQVAFALWIYVETWRMTGGMRGAYHFSTLRAILAYSIPFGLASAIGTLNIDIDKLLIGRLMDTESVALYSVAGKELPIAIIATSVAATVSPHIVRRMKDGLTMEAVDLWKTSIKLSFAVVSFLCAMSIVFAPQIMEFLYSERYLAGVAVFRVYLCMSLVRTTYFGMLLSAAGKPKYILYSSIMSLLMNAMLSWVLFHFIGFAGPAIAAVLSVVAITIAQLAYSARVAGMSLRTIYPWKTSLLLLGINGMLGGAVFLASSLSREAGHGLVLDIGIAAVAFALYAFLLRKRVRLWWNALKA